MRGKGTGRTVKILSVFDGMACGLLAMMSSEVKIDRYVAYEIDKYAVETSKHNFSKIEHKGDVFKADFTEYGNFDWLIGGSPCTYWSIAQTKNRETTASGLGWELFSQYVRALQEAKPKFFIYENNKSMSKEIKASISEAFGFEPICINSALVSAQNRQRLYWCGIRQEDGTYRKANVEQPEDRGILLRDILETTAIPYQDKANVLTASYDGAVIWNSLERHQRSMVAEPVNVTEEEKAHTIKAKKETVYEVKDGMITVKDKQYPIKLADGFYLIRKLTVRECMRLQTVPEWYEFPVSKTQAYKMLGNGWTVEVIAHLVKSILEDYEKGEKNT